MSIIALMTSLLHRPKIHFLWFKDLELWQTLHKALWYRNTLSIVSINIAKLICALAIYSGFTKRMNHLLAISYIDLLLLLALHTASATLLVFFPQLPSPLDVFSPPPTRAAFSRYSLLHSAAMTWWSLGMRTLISQTIYRQIEERCWYETNQKENMRIHVL